MQNERVAYATRHVVSARLRGERWLPTTQFLLHCLNSLVCLRFSVQVKVILLFAVMLPLEKYLYAASAWLLQPFEGYPRVSAHLSS